jgi:hypothetical protein
MYSSPLGVVPFPGEPIPSSGDAERHAALENMSRIQSEPGDRVYKDGVPFTAPATVRARYLHAWEQTWFQACDGRGVG